MKPRHERHAATMRARYGNRPAERQREPKTVEEWREVVLGACALRAVHDCKLYGLFTGGPAINVERCDELIERGRARGIVFSREDVNAAAVGIIRELNK